MRELNVWSLLPDVSYILPVVGDHHVVPFLPGKSLPTIFVVVLELAVGFWVCFYHPLERPVEEFSGCVVLPVHVSVALHVRLADHHKDLKRAALSGGNAGDADVRGNGSNLSRLGR